MYGALISAATAPAEFRRDQGWHFLNTTLAPDPQAHGRQRGRDARAGDVLIIGAGLAGLYLALKLAPRPLCRASRRRRSAQAASSAWAQGGLAAALDPKDSPAQHAADTVKAGAGLVDPVIARLIAEDGPARVLDLLALGVAV